jgi:hypothetical protein
MGVVTAPTSQVVRRTEGASPWAALDQELRHRVAAVCYSLPSDENEGYRDHMESPAWLTVTVFAL